MARTRKNTSPTASGWPLWGLLLLLYAGVALWFGQVRPIDGDEGFYAAAAGLVSEGAAPYRDFFYPQAPVAPYLYAGLVKVAGHHLQHLRVGSSLLAVLAVVPWVLYLRRQGPPVTAVALAGAMLILADPHLLSWNVTVKTFAAGNAFMSWCLFLLWRGLSGKSPLTLAGAGLLAGLAVATRALYGPMVLTLGLGLAVAARRRRLPAGLSGLAAFAAGGLLGSLPLWLAWLQDPDLFWFNNYTCHQIRYSDLRAQGLGQSFGPRAGAALAAAGQALLLSPYRLFMLVLAGLGWWSLGRGPGREDPHRPFQLILAAGAAAFLATNLLPDPVHPQYLTATAGPLLLPAAVLGLAALSGRWKKAPAWPVAALALALGSHALLVQKDGVNPEHEWTWESYRQVCALVEQHTEPNDMVASFWPGYVFETGRRHVPGMENHFAIGVSERLDARQKNRYHIIGKELLAEMFRARRPRAVVLGVWMNEVNTALDNEQASALLDVFHDHYCFETNVGRAKLALPCAKGNYGTLSD